MESPKFLRKCQVNVFKYIVIVIVTMAVWNLCADLISCPDTLSCAMGFLMIVTYAVLVISYIITDIKNLIK